MAIIFLLSLLILPPQLFAQQRDSHVSRQGKSIDPLNRPMDELGVTGHDTTLCSDRWYACSSYDRQQFDQRYIGVPLNELLRYGEPDWPLGQHQESGRTSAHDTFDFHDALDKD